MLAIFYRACQAAWKLQVSKKRNLTILNAMQKSSSIVFYFAKVLSLFSIYLFLQILQNLFSFNFLIHHSIWKYLISTVFENHRKSLIQIFHLPSAFENIPCTLYESYLKCLISILAFSPIFVQITLTFLVTLLDLKLQFKKLTIFVHY